MYKFWLKGTFLDIFFAVNFLLLRNFRLSLTIPIIQSIIFKLLHTLKQFFQRPLYSIFSQFPHSDFLLANQYKHDDSQVIKLKYLIASMEMYSRFYFKHRTIENTIGLVSMVSIFDLYQSFIMFYSEIMVYSYLFLSQEMMFQMYRDLMIFIQIEEVSIWSCFL